MRLTLEMEKMISNAKFTGITIPLWKVEALLHKENRIKRTNLPQQLILAMNNLNRIKEIRIMKLYKGRGFCIVDEEHYHRMAEDILSGPEFRSNNICPLQNEKICSTNMYLH
ncbi:hypothetical protein ACOME3_004658 [Neoechinorhynchus agilis]